MYSEQMPEMILVLTAREMDTAVIRQQESPDLGATKGILR